MKLHSFKQEQILPITLEKAWAFFSTPKNLNEITPEGLAFRIEQCEEGAMYEGQIISYRIRLAPLIWMRWVTEIKAIEERRAFVDEQRAGPYKFWHHRHFFEAVDDGVRMTDTVNYAVGWGPFGELAHLLFVRRQLQTIFGYRRKILEERFGGSANEEKK